MPVEICVAVDDFKILYLNLHPYVLFLPQVDVLLKDGDSLLSSRTTFYK